LNPSPVRIRCSTDSRSRSSSTTRTDGVPSECSVIVLTYSFVATQSQAVRLNGDAHRLFFRPQERDARHTIRLGPLMRGAWRSAASVAFRNTHVARSKQGSCGARYAGKGVLLGTFVRALCWIVRRGSFEERPRSCLTVVTEWSRCECSGALAHPLRISRSLEGRWTSS
jgi:hypothetical protein